MKPQPRRASEGEMLYGVKAIAAFLGIRERQALHLVETKRIPFFHTGKVICARPQRLLAWLDEQEAAAAAQPGEGAK